VTEAAHQTTGETRQAVARRHVDRGHEAPDEGQRIVLIDAFDQLAIANQARFVAAHLDACGRGETDDGITTEALPALHGFEQIGVWRVGKLQVDRQRRVEVGEGLERHRNAVVALGGETVEFEFRHGDSTTVVRYGGRARVWLRAQLLKGRSASASPASDKASSRGSANPRLAPVWRESRSMMFGKLKWNAPNLRPAMARLHAHPIVAHRIRWCPP